MKRWLADRGQTIPADGYMDHMMMPGMLSPEQLRQLDAARGREFERLFLRFMIRHHEGALTMVEQLFDTPGAGQEPTSSASRPMSMPTSATRSTS
jgi:uncharacterized protein (DUF305 family)